MSQLFGGGSTQKQKTTVQIPEFDKALQGLLVKLLLSRMFQAGGVPQTFGGWRQQGPRPMPQVPLTPDEQKYSQMSYAGLPSQSGGSNLPPNVNPLLSMFLGGKR